MKFIQSIIKYARPLKWICLTLSLTALCIRFFYGRSTELNNQGKFNLTFTGITLSVAFALFLAIGLLLWVFDSENRKLANGKKDKIKE